MISEAASSWRVLMHSLKRIFAGCSAKVNGQFERFEGSSVTAQPSTANARSVRAVVATTIVAAAALFVAGSVWPERQEFATLTLPTGHNLRAEIARTAGRRAEGLSERDRLDVDGLLLLWPAVGEHPIWMAGMRFPLDVVWLDEHNRVLAIVEGAEPCSSDPCPILRPADAARSLAVLEIQAGAAARYGLKVGSQVTQTLPDTIPPSSDHRQLSSVRSRANLP